MKMIKCLFFLGSLFSFILLASCEKEQNAPQGGDSIIGEWQMQDGTADAFEDGVKIFSGEIQTSGSMTFSENGAGTVDFSMTFVQETSEVVGSFNWERDGFELIIDDGSETQRWQLIDDEPNRKTVQLTQIDEDSGLEIALNLYMIRK